MKKCYSVCRRLSSKKRHAALNICTAAILEKKIFFVRLIICIINLTNFILIVLLHYEKKNPKKRLFFEHSNRCNPLSKYRISIR